MQVEYLDSLDNEAGRPRILAVDDDSTVLRSLTRVLSLDWEVTTVASAVEALDTIRANDPFPVVVTDLRMPGMDGVELIVEARSISPATKFIMLTGNQDENSALRIQQVQPFRSLNKPSASAEIRDAVSAALANDSQA